MLQFSGVISYTFAFQERKRIRRIYIKDGLKECIVTAADGMQNLCYQFIRNSLAISEQ